MLHGPSSVADWARAADAVPTRIVTIIATNAYCRFIDNICLSPNGLDPFLPKIVSWSRRPTTVVLIL